ncbi:MAG: futalosine hydrolase [Planctomycetota bacterium]
MPHALFVYAAPNEARVLACLPATHRVVEVGVGPARAAMNLTRALLLGPPPDLVVSVGVCGVYPSRLAEPAPPTVPAVGDVVLVTRDRFADEGVESEHGFVSAHALGLVGELEFTAPAELAEWAAGTLSLPRLSGATVSTCSASDARARELRQRSGAQVETMEGAAIALVSARFGLPWLQLRAVSNECGDRARAGWDLERALDRASEVVSALAGLLAGRSWKMGAAPSDEGRA